MLYWREHMQPHLLTAKIWFLTLTDSQDKPPIFTVS